MLRLKKVKAAGRTVEDIWQNEIKKSGKGKPPAPDSPLYGMTLEDSKKAYKELWKYWMDENPELALKLIKKINDENLQLTDSFAGPNTVSQAEALQEIAEEIIEELNAGGMDLSTKSYEDIEDAFKTSGGSLGAAKLNDTNVFDTMIEEYTPGNKFLDDFKSSVPGYILVPFEQMIESGLKMSGYKQAAKIASKLVAWELYTFATSLGANVIGRGEGALTSPRLAQAYLLLGEEEKFKRTFRKHRKRYDGKFCSSWSTINECYNKSNALRTGWMNGY